MTKLFAMMRAAVLIVAAVCVTLPPTPLAAQQAERRIALVIGQATYASGQLATAMADAGLVAATLTDAGFDVIEGGDLDEASMRRAMREFLSRVAAAGSSAVAFVYVAGATLQLDGDVVLIPSDARLASPGALAVETVRISDLTRALSSMPTKARFIVLDTAYAAPFPAVAGQVAPGLPTPVAEADLLVAYNQGPNMIAPPNTGAYGAYAVALTEMLREPGLSAEEVFQRVRLRVHERTQGAVTPWHIGQLRADFVFLAQDPQTGPAAQPPRAVADMRRRAPVEMSVEEAYALAVEQDTVAGYQAFLAAFPSDPLARRVRLLLAQRREAALWQRTVRRNSPEAFWTYMKAYPNGPNVADARRRLARLQAAQLPPAVFEEVIYEDLPPPPVEEVVIVERRYVYVEPLPPPPPVPVVILAPIAAYYLAPPPPLRVVRQTPFQLPAPTAPLPVVRGGTIPANVVRPTVRPVATQAPGAIPQQAGPGQVPGQVPGQPPTAAQPGGISPTTLGVATGVAVGAGAAALGAARLGTQLPPPNAARPAALPNQQLAPSTASPVLQQPPAADAIARQRQAIREREAAILRQQRAGRISPQEAARQRAALRAEENRLFGPPGARPTTQPAPIDRQRAGIPPAQTRPVPGTTQPARLAPQPAPPGSPVIDRRTRPQPGIQPLGRPQPGVAGPRPSTPPIARGPQPDQRTRAAPPQIVRPMPSAPVARPSAPSVRPAPPPVMTRPQPTIRQAPPQMARPQAPVMRAPPPQAQRPAPQQGRPTCARPPCPPNR